MAELAFVVMVQKEATQTRTCFSYLRLTAVAQKFNGFSVHNPEGHYNGENSTYGWVSRPPSHSLPEVMSVMTEIYIVNPQLYPIMAQVLCWVTHRNGSPGMGGTSHMSNILEIWARTVHSKHSMYEANLPTSLGFLSVLLTNDVALTLALAIVLTAAGKITFKK